MKTIKLIGCLFIGTLLFSQFSLSSSLVKLIKQGIFKFDTEVIDYGTIEQNSDGYRSFTFTNVGDSPIVITKTKGSCGCTVPSAPEEPILPGEKAEIKVKYATNRVGTFNKKVIIFSNAKEAEKIVTIKGKVIPAASTTEATKTLK